MRICRENAKVRMRQWKNGEQMQRVRMRQWENAEIMQRILLRQ
jgi:hypothetical protein